MGIVGRGYRRPSIYGLPRVPSGPILSKASVPALAFDVSGQGTSREHFGQFRTSRYHLGSMLYLIFRFSSFSYFGGSMCVVRMACPRNPSDTTPKNVSPSYTRMNTRPRSHVALP